MFKVLINSTFEPQKVVDTVKEEKVWKAITNEWYRLIQPYTPRRTGLLIQSATIKINPEKLNGEIAYKQKYAKKVYYGRTMNFRKDLSPYASAEWDKAAKPLQFPKLEKTAEKLIKALFD